MRTMIVRAGADFLELFPDASIHVLMADKVSNVDEKKVAGWQRKAADAMASWEIDPQRLTEQPWIADWRNAMTRMGLSAAKNRSSIEQLARRALSGSFIKTPIHAVNLYCAVSIIAKAPMGGYRLDSLKGDVTVKLANGSETFHGIGANAAIAVPAGVVVYSDGEKVACYAWNHKDSVQTCLTTQTERALFFADGATVEGRGRAHEGIRILADALADTGARVLSIGMLDRRVSVLTIPVGQEGIEGADGWDEAIHSA